MIQRRGCASSGLGLGGSPGSRWRSTWAGGEGGGMGHSPGHVTMTVRAIVIWTSSYEHDLPGVLQADGTCPLAVVLQVELSSTCQQTAATVTDPTQVSQRHLAQARLSCCWPSNSIPRGPVCCHQSLQHCGRTSPSWKSWSSTTKLTVATCALLTPPSVADRPELALCQGISYLIFRDAKRKAERVTDIEPRICRSGAKVTSRKQSTHKKRGSRTGNTGNDKQQSVQQGQQCQISRWGAHQTGHQQQSRPK